MMTKEIHAELRQAAYLAEEQNLPLAAEWLHQFVVGNRVYPTLAMFEANIDNGGIEIQCLTKEGIFLPCYGLDLEPALHERYRFPPLLRVTYAGHRPQS